MIFSSKVLAASVRSFRLGWFFMVVRERGRLEKNAQASATQNMNGAQSSALATIVQQPSASSHLSLDPWGVVNRSSRPVHLIDAADGVPWCGRKSAGGKVRFQSPLAVGDTLEELRAFGPKQQEVCERCFRRAPTQIADAVISA